MSWVEALKEYAKETGKFVLPKKDSPEYAKVKAIQERLAKATAVPPTLVKPKKAKVANVPVAAEAPTAAAVVEPVKVKKVRSVKVANVPVVLPVEAPVAPEPVPRKRKVIEKVPNPAPVPRGPTLVDRGVRLVNKEITLTFD